LPVTTEGIEALEGRLEGTQWQANSDWSNFLVIDSCLNF